MRYLLSTSILLAISAGLSFGADSIPWTPRQGNPVEFPTSNWMERFAARNLASLRGRIWNWVPESVPASEWKGASFSPKQYELWRVLLRREASLIKKKPVVLMLGDSLTFWLPPQLVTPRNGYANFGIAGDTTVRMLTRLHDYRELMPSGILLLIGINDFLFLDNGQTFPQKSAAIVKRTSALLLGLGSQFSNTQIGLISLLPTNGSRIPNQIILRHNLALKQLSAKFPHVTFLDVHHELAKTSKDRISYLDPALTTDGLHLNFQGYRVLVNAIDKHL